MVGRWAERLREMADGSWQMAREKDGRWELADGEGERWQMGVG